MSAGVRVARAVLVLFMLLSALLVGQPRLPTSSASGAVPTASAVVAAAPVRVTGPPDPPAPTGPGVRYRAPVAGPVQVLRGFDPPVSPYGPGHRGVDLRAGGPVIAAADGIVTFTGSVAGRGIVVLRHPDGIRTEYEPVRAAVRAGQRVRAGQLIGVVSGRHRGCPGSCLHWGARRDLRYLDPLALLRPLGLVRLLPWGHAAP